MKVNSYVKSLISGKMYRVTEVNEEWGWFHAIAPDLNKPKCFQLNGKWRAATPEEVADYLLKLTNLGIDDEWIN